jgi:tellurite resistance protein TerA
MNILNPGANSAVPTGLVTAVIEYATITGADIDVSAFLLGALGKVKGDGDMCFYGQTSVHKSAVQMLANTPGKVSFSLNLGMIDASIERIALTATIYENKSRFSACNKISIAVGSDIDAQIPTAGMQETALILGEFYLRNGTWKFRCVGQGFAGGLEPLAKHFGVEITAAEAPPTPLAPPDHAPKPTPSPSTINLSKISLDKKTASISLEKADGNFGEIKINLNWNRGGKGGFLGIGKNSAIDLDVGCLFEMKDGYRGAVQALGDCFGSYRDDPFIELMADDRTGASKDGEWLRINGNHWRDIKRILVFAFIYDGAANWHATDGVVTIYAPGQPPIEVKMSEEGGQQSMCAVALLENVSNSVRVSREVRFFRGHEKMDNAYGWGMNWVAGQK